ncbi:hypothetical protein Cgig2_032217 [Carnegiea gigantea]|uniref:Uncharacterized protein n=1 Tax=Carnegiea gigantea TaxID=171969 RepID=A0A9Q1JJ90_9CARY|nr:hypothetical protein Cgig2_032217 [Carnegiea gigantea]
MARLPRTSKLGSEFFKINLFLAFQHSHKMARKSPKSSYSRWSLTSMMQSAQYLVVQRSGSMPSQICKAIEHSSRACVSVSSGCPQTPQAMEKPGMREDMFRAVGREPTHARQPNMFIRGGMLHSKEPSKVCVPRKKMNRSRHMHHQGAYDRALSASQTSSSFTPPQTLSSSTAGKCSLLLYSLIFPSSSSSFYFFSVSQTPWDRIRALSCVWGGLKGCTHGAAAAATVPTAQTPCALLFFSFSVSNSPCGPV